MHPVVILLQVTFPAALRPARCNRLGGNRARFVGRQRRRRRAKQRKSNGRYEDDGRYGKDDPVTVLSHHLGLFNPQHLAQSLLQPVSP